jgi:hypothetical protein
VRNNKWDDEEQYDNKTSLNLEEEVWTIYIRNKQMLFRHRRGMHR